MVDTFDFDVCLYKKNNEDKIIMENEIFKGTAANDKTGTTAQQAADIINGNFTYLIIRITVYQSPDGVV
jgi:hypothetical protein